jgi:hypothetical protein
MSMPKYTVNIWVNKEYTLTVDAPSEEAAKEIAVDQYCDMDDPFPCLTESVIDTVFVK